MIIHHKDLTKEKWFTYSMFTQMANVGVEVERAIHWKKQFGKEQSQKAFERALELLYLTIIDPKNKGPRGREMNRVREVLKDYFWGDNEYKSTDELWHQYFYAFNYAAALERGK